MTIDLRPFCSTNPDLKFIHIQNPFSRGEWTYATDGRIIVRVSRRDDIPENPKAPNVEKIFATVSFDDLAPLWNLSLGTEAFETCDSCDGRGKEHDCPYCTCECEDCDGSGQQEVLSPRELRGVVFNSKYLRLIVALPNPHFARVAKTEAPNPFRFDGGEGCLMPMTVKKAEPAEVMSS